MNFPYPDDKDIPIKALIPGNSCVVLSRARVPSCAISTCVLRWSARPSTRCVYWAMKIDDSNRTWGAYVFKWEYKLHEDLPQPHLRAHTDPTIDQAPAGGEGGDAPGGDGPAGVHPDARDDDPAGRAPTPTVDSKATDGTIKQWSCPRCTFLNPYMTNTCDMCNMVRPA